MYNFFKFTAPNADAIPLFFLVAFFGPVISLLFITHGAIEFQSVAFLPTPLAYGRLPIALTIPEIQSETPVKTILQPAVIVVPAVAYVAAEARLFIPKIGVNAVILEMGVTPEGAMDVPGNRFDIGWYSLGTRPGEEGSAVLGGHNRWEDGAAVFERLHELVAGDVLTVVDTNGVSSSFIVRETRTYDPMDAADDIFLSENGAHLNLITCSGIFDAVTKTYSQRLVVFADLE